MGGNNTPIQLFPLSCQIGNSLQHLSAFEGYGDPYDSVGQAQRLGENKFDIPAGHQMVVLLLTLSNAQWLLYCLFLGMK
jgi:hypothetical protein